MLWILWTGLIAAIVILISWFCYRLVFYNRNDKPDDPMIVPPGEQYEAVAQRMCELVDKVNQIPFEPVFLMTEDGIRLSGRYYHVAEGAPVQLHFHGYHGNGIREFCGGWHLANSMGINSLVIDQRAHGRSGGHTITFGIKERFDCLHWARYAAERFGEDIPLILSGVSMGGATVLMASDLELPKSVVAILADCPYSSPGGIIRKVCQDAKMPPWLAYPFIVLGGLLFGKFRIWDSSALQSVRNTRIPIHLTHGEADLFVPCQMSIDIREASAAFCKLLTIPGAGHGLSYLIDPKTYEHSVTRFLTACLADRKET